MKLYLQGHEYKYAVEQMLMTLFAGEKPEYPAEDCPGDKIVVKLSTGAEYTTVSCHIKRGEGSGRGRAAVKNAALTDPVETDRNCQRLIKNAMYRAALDMGMPKPPWGALTGVRPGKLLCRLLEQGMSRQKALSSFIREYDVSPQRAELCMDTSRETLKVLSTLEDRDICLYVGIPFCPTRCSYCSFVSQSVEKSMNLIEPFLAALEKEIRATAAQVKKLGLRVVALYMGGGTPTSLTAAQLDRLCTVLEREFDLSRLREYTVEAGRPDTISPEKLSTLRRHGVDRVSVNPQTMDDRVLELIGRRHSAEDIVKALGQVRQEPGLAVNMDLIAGLPGDSVEGFKKTLDKVLSLGAENITVHTLSLKKGSVITLKGAELPSGEQVAQMLDMAGQRLRAAGYVPYYLYRQKFMSGGFENVGWTKPGYVNIYNICIMEELCSIIAMGGGGSTKLIRRDGGRNIRLVAPKYPLEYIQGIDRVAEQKEKISCFYLAAEGKEVEE